MYFSCCVEQGYSQQGKPVGKSGQGQATGKFLQQLESVLTYSQYLSVSVSTPVCAKAADFCMPRNGQLSK